MSWLHQSRYPSRILSGARCPIPGGVWTIVETGRQGCAVLVDSRRRRRSPDSRAMALGTDRADLTTLHLAYQVYDHKSRGSSAQQIRVRSRDWTARIRDGPRNGVHNAAMSIYPAVRCTGIIFLPKLTTPSPATPTYSPAVLCICMLRI
jgi:hypothetical protein